MSNFVGVKPKFDNSAKQCTTGRPNNSKRSTDRCTVDRKRLDR